jgi:hypothetical protein
MLKKSLLIGALALLAAFNSQARIGYTLDECIKQYGMPYSKIDWDAGLLYEWHIGDTYVQAWIDNGKVVYMHYAREFLKKFSGVEVQDLYLKNGGLSPNLWGNRPPEDLVVELYDTFGNGISIADAFSQCVQSVRIVTPERLAKEKKLEAEQAHLRSEQKGQEEIAKKKAFDSL